MGVAALAATFAVGLPAGLLSGRVGIGGGVLMVPFLYFFYAHPALSGLRAFVSFFLVVGARVAWQTLPL